VTRTSGGRARPAGAAEPGPAAPVTQDTPKRDLPDLVDTAASRTRPPAAAEQRPGPQRRRDDADPKPGSAAGRRRPTTQPAEPSRS
jgi:hypothetical protein